MKYRPVVCGNGEMRRRSFASEGRFGEAEPEDICRGEAESAQQVARAVRASVRVGGSKVESRS